MLTRVLPATLLSLTLFQTAFAQRPIRLQRDTSQLHFTVIEYFPLVDATVNGIKGKVMFDTGNEKAFSFNDHLVKQGGGIKIGPGFAGSGESYDVYRYDTIQQVLIGNMLKYENNGPANGYNLSFLEALTPDFLGFLGYDFFKGYLFKMDYKKGLITFYKSTSGRKDFLKGEKVIGVLDFTTGKLPNHPVVHVKVGGVDMIGLFDTGQLGAIYLSDSLRKVLTDKQVIVPGADPGLVSLNSIELAGGFSVALDQVYNSPANNAQGFKQAMGITEENILSIGYSFLKQYKTVWDFETGKLYLLLL
jgi:hypothetical protein